jgi:hypothetical protein
MNGLVEGIWTSDLSAPNAVRSSLGAKLIMGYCPRMNIQAIMGRRNISWIEIP